MQETWKPVVGFEGRYEVSSEGRFRALARDIIYKDGRKGKLKAKMIRGYVGSHGYLIVSFDSTTKALAHRVVAEAFLGVHEFRVTVNHKDGNKLNNNINNLEWVTYGENNNHARRTNLNIQHGERTNLTKYTDQFIAAVRNVYAKYSPSYEELGRLFGITGAHARQIVLFQTRTRETCD